jgi:hypothetical protein
MEGRTIYIPLISGGQKLSAAAKRGGPCRTLKVRTAGSVSRTAAFLATIFDTIIEQASPKIILCVLKASIRQFSATAKSPT